MGDFIRYIPHTKEDCRKMLETIGVKKVEDLFESIPQENAGFRSLSTSLKPCPSPT